MERAMRTEYDGNSARDNARQINGNITNNVNYNYTLRRKQSDDSLHGRERCKVLLVAAAEGQTHRVKHLFGQHANIDYSDEYGLTALHHAALSGFSDTAQVILEAGADVNAASLDCGTPLHLAALKARVDIVHMLLAYRADLERKSRSLGSVMHCACYTGSQDIILLLRHHGAKDVPAVVRPSLLMSVSSSGTFVPMIPSRGEDGTYEPMTCLMLCMPFHVAVLSRNANLCRLMVEMSSHKLFPRTVHSPCTFWGASNLDDDCIIPTSAVESLIISPLMLALLSYPDNAEFLVENGYTLNALHDGKVMGALAAANKEIVDRFMPVPPLVRAPTLMEQQKLERRNSISTTDRFKAFLLKALGREYTGKEKADLALLMVASVATIPGMIHSQPVAVN